VKVPLPNHRMQTRSRTQKLDTALSLKEKFKGIRDRIYSNVVIEPARVTDFVHMLVLQDSQNHITSEKDPKTSGSNSDVEKWLEVIRNYETLNTATKLNGAISARGEAIKEELRPQKTMMMRIHEDEGKARGRAFSGVGGSKDGAFSRTPEVTEVKNPRKTPEMPEGPREKNSSSFPRNRQ
jgi:hypothetical protein